MSLQPKPYTIDHPLNAEKAENINEMFEQLYDAFINNELGAFIPADDVLDVESGGTGLSSYTIGDILYASAATVLSKLADIATGNALISGGVATAPSWGKIGLTTHVSGTLPVANGGTNITSYTIGDLLYASASGVLSLLADVAAGAYLRSGGVGVAPVWSTLLLPNAAAIGEIPYGSAANVISMLGVGTSGQVLTSAGAGVAPAWATASGGITGLLTNGDAAAPELIFDSFGDVITVV